MNHEPCRHHFASYTISDEIINPGKGICVRCYTMLDLKDYQPLIELPACELKLYISRDYREATKP